MLEDQGETESGSYNGSLGPMIAGRLVCVLIEGEGEEWGDASSSSVASSSTSRVKSRPGWS